MLMESALRKEINKILIKNYLELANLLILFPD